MQEIYVVLAEESGPGSTASVVRAFSDEQKAGDFAINANNLSDKYSYWYEKTVLEF
jgi:hypothetical protein